MTGTSTVILIFPCGFRHPFGQDDGCRDKGWSQQPKISCFDVEQSGGELCDGSCWKGVLEWQILVPMTFTSKRTRARERESDTYDNGVATPIVGLRRWSDMIVAVDVVLIFS